MGKGTSRKNFQNEEISFNPFQELLGDKPHHPEPTEEKRIGTPPEMGHHENRCVDLLSSFLPSIQKISMRIERKGRRGKTVTHLDITPVPSSDVFACLMKILKKKLGCGASIEDKSRIVVQGDQRGRLAKWFTEQGLRNIISG